MHSCLQLQLLRSISFSFQEEAESAVREAITVNQAAIEAEIGLPLETVGEDVPEVLDLVEGRDDAPPRSTPYNVHVAYVRAIAQEEGGLRMREDKAGPLVEAALAELQQSARISTISSVLQVKANLMRERSLNKIRAAVGASDVADLYQVLGRLVPEGPVQLNLEVSDPFPSR